jgi:hypothetical protein
METSINKLLPETRNKLRAPLPAEAITKHPTKSFLSTIKAIYVVERLNDVFGIGEWYIEYDIIEAGDKWIVAKGILTVPHYGIRIEQYGGNDNSDRGDAFKGACTDCLTKIGSYLEIGIDVFKGLVNPEGLKEQDERPWMKEKQFNEASQRIKDANPYISIVDGDETLSLKPQEFYERLLKTYQMKRMYKEGLKADVEFQETLSK